MAPWCKPDGTGVREARGEEKSAANPTSSAIKPLPLGSLAAFPVAPTNFSRVNGFAYRSRAKSAIWSELATASFGGAKLAESRAYGVIRTISTKPRNVRAVSDRDLRMCDGSLPQARPRSQNVACMWLLLEGQPKNPISRIHCEGQDEVFPSLIGILDYPPGSFQAYRR